MSDPSYRNLAELACALRDEPMNYLDLDIETIDWLEGFLKLSYNLQRELEQLPQNLKQLEAELETLQAQVTNTSFFSSRTIIHNNVLADMASAKQALKNGA